LTAEGGSWFISGDEFDSGEQAAYRCQASDAGLSLAAAADQPIGRSVKA